MVRGLADAPRLLNQPDVLIQRRGRDTPARKVFDPKRHADGTFVFVLNRVGVALALQAQQLGEFLKGKAHFGAKCFDVHVQRSHMTNTKSTDFVRRLHDDQIRRRPQNANMAKRVDKHLPNEHYDALRQASGWYLQAWRHFKNLSLEELAEEANTSRGQVHDLETASPRKDGRPPARFNRDWIDRMSRALDVTGGYLIDVNPFASNNDFTQLKAAYDELDDRAKADAQRLIAALKAR